MIGHVPLIGRDPGAIGKAFRPFGIACIVCGNGEPRILQCDTDCFANAATAAGYDGHFTHTDSPLRHLRSD